MPSSSAAPLFRGDGPRTGQPNTARSPSRHSIRAEVPLIESHNLITPEPNISGVSRFATPACVHQLAARGGGIFVIRFVTVPRHDGEQLVEAVDRVLRLVGGQLVP